MKRRRRRQGVTLRLTTRSVPLRSRLRWDPRALLSGTGATQRVAPDAVKKAVGTAPARKGRVRFSALVRAAERKNPHALDLIRAILRPGIGPDRLRNERICAKRRIRKQVLFAQDVAGRSGGSPGPYRRTADSKEKC